MSPSFLEHGSAEKVAVWAHANCDPNKSEVGTLIKYTRSKIKNKKTYRGWCPFQGLSNGTTLMQIQSVRMVPLSQVIFYISL